MDKESVIYDIATISDIPELVRLVSAAYLLIIEQPANPFFLNSLDSEVLSVYTEEEYRGKGICTSLMRNMIEYAREHQICRIDLVATDDRTYRHPCPYIGRLGSRKENTTGIHPQAVGVSN